MTTDPEMERSVEPGIRTDRLVEDTLVYLADQSDARQLDPRQTVLRLWIELSAALSSRFKQSAEELVDQYDEWIYDAQKKHWEADPDVMGYCVEERGLRPIYASEKDPRMILCGDRETGEFWVEAAPD